MKRGIDPALVKKLDDLGIDPSKYDELGIVDSEFKILNDIASKLGNDTNASGTIKLFTERTPCASCDNVIFESPTERF